MDLMNTKLLVKAIIERAEHYEWSFQGFGMFRLYLSPTVRLHVWDQRLATENVSTIHNHPWHFVSRVISGRLVDHEFYEETPQIGVPFLKQRIVCGPGGCSTGEPQPVWLRLASMNPCRAGDSYMHGNADIHETETEPGTITIVRREFLEDTEHADVYFPVGTSWVSAEPRPATVEEIHGMKETALRLL